MIVVEAGRIGIARQIYQKFDLNFINNKGENVLTIFLNQLNLAKNPLSFENYSDFLGNLIEETFFDLDTQKYVSKYILQNLFDKKMNACPLIELISKYPKICKNFKNFQKIKNFSKDFEYLKDFKND